MTLIKKGWFCPTCEALISSKRYGPKLVTCDCYEKGSNICMAESRKNNVDSETNINWYNLIEKAQEKWKRLYMKSDDNSNLKPETDKSFPQPPNPKLVFLKKRART